jgi:hypothetical protein
VDARARVEAGRSQLDSRAVGLSLDEHRAAAFGRARLDPEDAVVVEIDDDPAEPRVARARRRSIEIGEGQDPYGATCFGTVVLLTGQNT